MKSFRVVIVAPNGNQHSAAFRELALSLVTAIRENGYQCDIAVNELHPSAVNVILGFHLLGKNDIPTDITYIVYQLEQLSHSEGWLTHHPDMLDVMRSARAVWDYSPENVSFLREEGIAAELVPAGYSELLKAVPMGEKDIDVLFYGSRNDRRSVVLEELVSRGFRVKALFGVYAEERDLWIARSHLVVNVHFYEANLFESVRVSYLVNNGVPVVSEESPSYPWPEVPLKRVPYNSFVDTVEELLQDLEQLRIYGEECQKQFAQHYAMKDLVKAHLEM